MKKLSIPQAAVLITALTVTPLIGARTPERPEVDCRVELDRSILPAGGTHTAIVKVTLEAPPAPKMQDRPPVNLAIVLDRSGSMSGSKLEDAKEAAIKALRRLDRRDLFSQVINDDSVQTLIPAQSAGNSERIEAKIRKIRSGGNTALFGGVSQGASELRKHIDGRYVHRIILLSDGLANEGPSSPADLGRLGAALLKEQISVTTIGLGNDFNEDLMTQLAQKSDGNHYFVEKGSDLARIFTAELGEVLSVVACKVKLSIECPEGIRPLRVIGREARIRGSKVELNLNQLYGGQEKFALVEVEIPATEADRERPVALASCSYEHPVTQLAMNSSGRISARFSTNLATVEASANDGVISDLIVNNVAESKNRAITLWDEGKKEDAVEELQQAARYNEQLANQYKVLPSAQADIQQLEKDAEDLQQAGMTKQHRKAMRSDAYQAQNQQMIENPE